MEIAELISEINKHIAGDKAKAKELAKAMRSDAKDVAQLLINVGAGQKSGETQSKVTDLETKLRETTEKLEETERDFTEFKSKTPDVATIEARERAKWEPKVKAKDDELKAAREQFKGAVGRGGRVKFTRELIALGADPEYAEQVAAQKYGDRLNPKDDGSLGVFQIGEQVEYDGDEDAKIKALAADAYKTVPAKFRLTNADSGAGVRSGGGGSAYDAAKEGTEMGKREKAQATDNKLAFT